MRIHLTGAHANARRGPIRTGDEFLSCRASGDATNANICARVKEFVVQNNHQVLKAEIFSMKLVLDTLEIIKI